MNNIIDNAPILMVGMGVSNITMQLCSYHFTTRRARYRRPYQLSSDL